MTDIFSVNNINTQTPAYAWGIRNGRQSRFSEAPVVLPKYSLNKALQEKDEFRKSVNTAIKQAEEKNEKRKGKGTILTLGGALGAFLLLKAKKIK